MGPAVRRLERSQPIPTTDLAEFLAEALYEVAKPGEHLVVVVPDDSRTVPMKAVFDAAREHAARRVGRLTFLVALGTHPPMTEAQLDAHFGPDRRGSDVRIVQHAWRDPDVLVSLGTIKPSEVERLSGGLLAESVPVRINRLALEADRMLIVNPVFPHEVVGFSGGHKYFFPGISGPEIVGTTHWLGALITNPKVNGHRDTPVRALIERAARMVPTPRSGLAFVMKGHAPVGVFFDEVYDAWAAAVELSRRTNIVWCDRAYDTVLSVAPPMYRDLWTAGKCMYKLEPVVADGGRLIIRAPHIEGISETHGEAIRGVGYHTRDYFLSRLGEFADVPRAVLAHSTHVKGIGRFRDGTELPRIEVGLATGIPESVCGEINLDYVPIEAADPEDYQGMEKDGILVVPNAGEVLYRLADGSVPDVDRL